MSPVSPSVLGLMVFQAESSKSVRVFRQPVAPFRRHRRQLPAPVVHRDASSPAAAAMNVSGSWQLGSPLPTPRILPAPSMAKLILFCAIGTTRPCASSGGNGEHAHVLAIGVDGRAVGRELNAPRRRRWFPLWFRRSTLPPSSKPFALKRARRVFHLPRQFGIRLHRLFAERLRR